MNSGEKFKIFCYLKQGTQPVTFEWRKNDDKFTTDNSDQYRVDTLGETSILTILQVSTLDVANFSCSVHNHYGSDVQSTWLNVKGRFIVFFLDDEWRDMALVTRVQM